MKFISSNSAFSVCHARELAYTDECAPFLLLFSKWLTSSSFVELSEDDIYHFCEQQENVVCLLVLVVIVNAYSTFNLKTTFFTIKRLNKIQG